MTYYEILNINKNASEKDIKIAYRALAKKYHPDTYKGNKNIAEEKMKQINEAYDVLSNKELKMKYDEQFSTTTYSASKESYSQPENMRNSYYGSDYKAPDPPDADYRSYYNYSPYYESEPEYDFSKLKELFQGSKLKVTFVIIGILAIFVFLGNMVNQIKVKASELLESMNQPIQGEPEKELIPQNNYISELPTNENIENSDSQVYFDFNQEEFEKKLEHQLKEWEEQYNHWYENEGKEYGEQIKNELNLLYEDIKNQVNTNY